MTNQGPPGGIILIMALGFSAATAAVSGLGRVPRTADPMPEERVALENAGFETDGGWSGLRTRDSAYDAPVEGRRYALLGVSDEPLLHRTAIVVEEGMQYELTLWARSVHDDDHLRRLAAASEEVLPVTGTTARARARVALGAEGESLVAADIDVSPRALLGDAATIPNDDGANVWVDGGYRMQFNDVLLRQPVASDPITDPWMIWASDGHDPDMAVGVVSVPGGRRFVLDCFYEDDPPIGGRWHSLISIRELTGSPLDYRWGERRTVLENESWNTGDSREQFPWVIDPHAYWDADEERLWLSWGGHDLYVTELDPDTGRVIDAGGRPVGADVSDLDPRLADDPVHTMVIRQQPEESLHDPWRRSSYQEGPAMYRHGGFFHYFATFGDLAHDYTIRVGRSVDPRGPYLDRDGRPLIDGGGTFLLGDDTDQLVPGHPHVWEEDGAFFLGYDYRTRRSEEDEALDFMGIRRLHWVDGWPTIWRPITVVLRADEHPEAIGRRLTISVVNAGDDGSVLAVDRVRLRRTGAPTPLRNDSP